MVHAGLAGAADDQISPYTRLTVLLLLLMPALLFILLRGPLIWLVGLSAAVGKLPSLPLLPFLQDYAHVVMLIFFVVTTLNFAGSEARRKIPHHVALFAGYILICAISAVANFVLHENIWQAKVGISFLLLFCPVSFLIFALAVERREAALDFDRLLDGFVWGVFAQAAIGIVALPLLVYMPSTEGNDTLFGLGYYYRYKSTFANPVWLAFFFVVSIPMLLLWLHRTGRSSRIALLYLQFAPWLIMATASRTARIAAIAPFFMLLVHKQTRRYMLGILPSAVIAYWMCFSYVSLASAVNVVVGSPIDPSFYMADRFFVTTERVELVNDTFHRMLHSSALINLIGNGPGVGGYSESGFPAAHNMLMNVWVETGAVGLTLFVGFLMALLWSVLRHAIGAKPNNVHAWLILTSIASFALANAAYQTAYWGYALVIVLFAVCGARTLIDWNSMGEALSAND
jgi:hypothetical protein